MRYTLVDMQIKAPDPTHQHGNTHKHGDSGFKINTGKGPVPLWRTCLLEFDWYIKAVVVRLQTAPGMGLISILRTVARFDWGSRVILLGEKVLSKP